LAVSEEDEKGVDRDRTTATKESRSKVKRNAGEKKKSAVKWQR
jgi:hypothetical protein